MANQWRLVWRLIVLLCALSNGFAQKRHMHFNRLSIYEGLSQSTINAIAQDRYGFMWFATQEGLNRYDGYQFVVYGNQPGKDNSLASDFVSALVVDTRGTLWVATHEGVLHRYDPKTDSFTRFTLQPDTINSPPDNIVMVAQKDYLWIGLGAKALVRFNTKDFSQREFSVENGKLESNGIAALCNDHRDVLWLGNRKGLFRYDADRDSFTAMPHPEDHNASQGHRGVRALHEDHEGRLWAYTYTGLDMLDKDRRSWREILPGAFDEMLGRSALVTTMASDDHSLWLGGNQGLFRMELDTSSLELFTNDQGAADSLSNTQILSLMLDNNHVLWVGTGSGLNFTDRTSDNFVHFKSEADEVNALANDTVWSILEDNKGLLWVGHDAGLDRIDRGKGTVDHFVHDPRRPGSMGAGATLGIVQARDGSIWLAGQDGISHFVESPDASTHYRHDPNNPTSLSDDTCFSILEDRSGTLWVATARGLNRMVDPKRGTFQHYLPDRSSANALQTEQLFFLYEDRANNLWIGTFDGASRLDATRNHFTHFAPDPKRNDRLTSGTCYALLQDQLDRMWIGTSGGLNLMVSEGVFRRFGTQEGLPNKTINALLEDKQGNLWISTNRGLARMDPKNFGVTRFDVYNGLQSNEFNTCAAFESPSTGELFFGGINGFNVFVPERIKTNPIPPKVLVTGLRVFNQEVPFEPNAKDALLKRPIYLEKQLVFNYHQKVFTLELAALHYAHPSGNRYAYQLHGFHDDWVYADASQRFATFTNLSPGTYTLAVKAANSDGIWSEPVETLHIRVLPPPWRSWWAYTIYLLIVFFLIASYIRYQNLKLASERAHNEQLRQLDRLKDEFLANTSHELRTPLNGIIGIAESLLAGAAGETNEKMAGNLGMIVSSGRRLASLVNDLLDFSKIRSHNLRLNRKPVDIVTLVDVIFSLSQPLVGNRELRLINALPLDTPLVEGDEDRLQQILHNLVGNAVKFTESGHIRVVGSLREKWLDVSIEDTGSGIPEDQFERIFESFEQVDGSAARQSGGTGLGLAITRQLVELHGGTISVRSVLGVGSTFTFNLPLAGSEAIPTEHRAPVKAPAPPSPSRASLAPLPVVTSSESRFKILIVDDEAVNRQVLVNHLGLQGYTIAEVHDGQEALRQLEAEPFDLVLLDVMMPQLDGYEVCRRLRQKFTLHELPIIFLTAKSQSTDLSNGFSSGANDFLVKPIEREELLSRVMAQLTLLEGHRNLENRVEERTRELKMAYKTLEDMSLTDPLTGLRNRRYVLKNIDADVAQTTRAYLNWLEAGQVNPPPREQDMVFFLVDMDHFKSVNDTYGHAAGDEVLIQLRILLEKAFRASDYLVRWGGEEFLVVARFSTRDSAAIMAERLRAIVAAHAFDIGGGQRIHRTCSIGFAAYPFLESQPRLMSWSQVVDLADLSLYAAKRSNRNAWVGIFGTEKTDHNDLMRRIIADAASESRSGHLSIKSSLEVNQINWKTRD